MADEFAAEGTLANVLSGVANRSRLTSPDRRAYDPSTAEISILNQLGGPGASQLVGFLGGARADRQAASDQYDNSLAAVNNRAAILAQQEDATKRRGQDVNLTVAGTQNPDSAAAFALMRNQIRPEARGLMDQMLATRGDYRRAQVQETLAQAANHMADAANGGGGRGRDPAVAENRMIDSHTRGYQGMIDNALVVARRDPANLLPVATLPGTNIPVSNAPRELRPDVVARINAEVQQRAGVAFPRARQIPGVTPAQAAGNSPPATAPAPVTQPAAPAAAAPTVVTPEARDRAQAEAARLGGRLQVHQTTGEMRIKMPNGTSQPVGQ